MEERRRTFEEEEEEVVKRVNSLSITRKKSARSLRGMSAEEAIDTAIDEQENEENERVRTPTGGGSNGGREGGGGGGGGGGGSTTSSPRASFSAGHGGVHVIGGGAGGGGAGNGAGGAAEAALKRLQREKDRRRRRVERQQLRDKKYEGEEDDDDANDTNKSAARGGGDDDENAEAGMEEHVKTALSAAGMLKVFAGVVRARSATPRMAAAAAAAAAGGGGGGGGATTTTAEAAATTAGGGGTGGQGQGQAGAIEATLAPMITSSGTGGTQGQAVSTATGAGGQASAPARGRTQSALMTSGRRRSNAVVDRPIATSTSISAPRASWSRTDDEHDGDAKKKKKKKEEKEDTERETEDAQDEFANIAVNLPGSAMRVHKGVLRTVAVAKWTGRKRWGSVAAISSTTTSTTTSTSSSSNSAGRTRASSSSSSSSTTVISYRSSSSMSTLSTSRSLSTATMEMRTMRSVSDISDQRGLGSARGLHVSSLQVSSIREEEEDEEVKQEDKDEQDKEERYEIKEQRVGRMSAADVISGDALGSVDGILEATTTGLESTGGDEVVGASRMFPASGGEIQIDKDASDRARSEHEEEEEEEDNDDDNGDDDDDDDDDDVDDDDDDDDDTSSDGSSDDQEIVWEAEGVGGELFSDAVLAMLPRPSARDRNGSGTARLVRGSTSGSDTFSMASDEAVGERRRNILTRLMERLDEGGAAAARELEAGFGTGLSHWRDAVLHRSVIDVLDVAEQLLPIDEDEEEVARGVVAMATRVLESAVAGLEKIGEAEEAAFFLERAAPVEACLGTILEIAERACEFLPDSGSGSEGATGGYDDHDDDFDDDGDGSSGYENEDHDRRGIVLLCEQLLLQWIETTISAARPSENEDAAAACAAATNVWLSTLVRHASSVLVWFLKLSKLFYTPGKIAGGQRTLRIAVLPVRELLTAASKELEARSTRATVDGIDTSGDAVFTPEWLSGLVELVPPSCVLHRRDVSSSSSRNLGAGSFGRVVASQWFGAAVALKTFYFDAESRRALDNELRVMSALRHPRIVSFVGVLMESSYSALPVLAMEFLPNGSLFDALDDIRTLAPDKLAAKKAASALVAWRRRLWCAYDIASALVYLHSLGFVHRDLRSANVLLDAAMRAKLADFSTTHEAGMRCPLDFFPDPKYMAPEVLQSAPDSSPSATRLSLSSSLSRSSSRSSASLSQRTASSRATSDVDLLDVEIGVGVEADVFSFGVLLWEVRLMMTLVLVLIIMSHIYTYVPIIWLSAKVYRYGTSECD